jgi:gas vesicle protein
MLYLLLGLALAAGVTIYLVKQGKIKDTDGDFIPDVVEEKVEDVKEVVKETKKRVKKVKEEVEDVIEEVQDVVSAVKGKPTKSKLNSLTKQDLVNSAKADHGIDLDPSIKKTTLVNKVYSLYNKK